MSSFRFQTVHITLSWREILIILSLNLRTLDLSTGTYEVSQTLGHDLDGALFLRKWGHFLKINRALVKSKVESHLSSPKVPQNLQISFLALHQVLHACFADDQPCLPPCFRNEARILNKWLQAANPWPLQPLNHMAMRLRSFTVWCLIIFAANRDTQYVWVESNGGRFECSKSLAILTWTHNIVGRIGRIE